MRFSIIFVFLAWVSASSLWAQSERILSYHSRIVVREDGSMVVTETIKVHALGRKIRRGIYRDFPTLYSGPYFTRVHVPFRVNRVSRNGQREPFHQETLSRGIRLYIGKEDRTLNRGEHTYQIEYETDRQLGYFENHDELYWNVTGTEWGFSIREASAAVILPPGVPRSEIDLEGYTGPQGSKEKNYRSSVDATGGEVRFSTTESLSPGEGLTIVVSFPRATSTNPPVNRTGNDFVKPTRISWWLRSVWPRCSFTTSWPGCWWAGIPRRGASSPRLPLQWDCLPPVFAISIGWDLTGSALPLP